MTNRYVGVKGVAAWCGVTQAAVSKWLVRFPALVPSPDVSIGELDMEDEEGNVIQERVHPDLGWTLSRKTEWLRFANRHSEFGGQHDGTQGERADTQAQGAGLPG